MHVETLESRRFLSSIDIGLIDDPTPWNPGDDLTQRTDPIVNPPAATVTLPNIKRTYSGSFALGTGLSGTFKLYVRKEEIRTDYAALRGTLYINTLQTGIVSADMTYGKLRSNMHINMTLVGTTPPFNVTITGKVNSTGSQMKGQADVTGSVSLSTTFIISKVVHQ